MKSKSAAADQDISLLYNEVSAVFALHGLTDGAQLLAPVVEGQQTLDENAAQLKTMLESGNE